MQVVVDRIEGDLAVLVFPDQQQVNVPVISLPFGSKEGDTLQCAFSTDVSDAQDRAKALLNELLNHDDETS